MQRGDFATKSYEIATKFSYLIAKCDWMFSLTSSPERVNIHVQKLMYRYDFGNSIPLRCNFNPFIPRVAPIDK